MTKVIGIIALKGGVGKTSCTANLGAALAMNFGQKVLLVDANFSAPNLGFHFGLFEPKATLQQVFSGKKKIQNVIHEYSSNLHIIPSSLNAKPIRNPFFLNKNLATIKKYYDVILIDASPNLNNEILSTMIASDSLYVVTSPDYPTLSTTIKAIKVARQKRTPIKGLILNKARNKKFELTFQEIEEAAEIPILGNISDDIKMMEAVAEMKPIHERVPNSNSAIEFNKIAAHLIGVQYNDPRFFSKIKKLFGQKITKIDVNRAHNE